MTIKDKIAELLGVSPTSTYDDVRLAVLTTLAKEEAGVLKEAAQVLLSQPSPEVVPVPEVVTKTLFVHNSENDALDSVNGCQCAECVAERAAHLASQSNG